MGSGLSMTSVNKIKELAESREYSLAVDILDSQDLSKSLNPQFLRLCGVIYTETGRYVDARRALVMAHRLAPEAKRVIYSIIYLYLKMGYKDLAQTYYDIYMFDAETESIDTKQVMYIMDKASGKSLNELKEHIVQTYSNTIDYDWTYEVILLHLADGETEEAEILYEDYKATYKNDVNSAKIQSVLEGKTKAEDYLFVFNDQVIVDDAPEQEDIRLEELKLLAADDLRIHPREAEITIMVDDNDEVEIGSKRKLKKYLREQEKQKKQEEIAGTEEPEKSDAEEDSVADAEKTQEADVETASEEKTKGRSFFKKLFSKNKEAEAEDDSAEAENDSAEAESDSAEAESDSAEAESNDAEESNSNATESDCTESENREADNDINIDDLSGDTDTEEVVEEKIFEQSLAETVEDSDEDLDMREIHLNQHTHGGKAKVSVEFGEDFTAESDSIDGLRDDNDFSNPFDSISALKKDKNESRDKLKSKMEMIFEDAGLSDEESDYESVFDDFGSYPEDEFGEMKSRNDEFVKEDEEQEFNFKDDEFFSKIEAELEEYEESKSDGEIEFNIEADFEAEPETEEAEAEPELEEEEVEAEPEEEEVEEEPEVEEVEEEPETEEAEEEPEVEEAEEEPETEEAEAEPEVEEAEAEPETEEAEAEPEVEEAEAEPETEEAEAETVTDFSVKEAKLEENKDRFFIPDDDKYKLSGNLDFPVFKSSLFPNHNKNITEVENNFSEIMTKAQDKMNENLLREEQMQREAEALLASLGIDLGSVSSTPVSHSVPKEKTVSRKELKESLKIDSNQKNILKKLKEYR